MRCTLPTSFTNGPFAFGLGMAGLALMALVLAGCDAQAPLDGSAASSAADAVSRARTAPGAASASAALSPDAQIASYMASVNEALAADGAPYRIAKAEWLGAPDSDNVGNTVLAKDVGNKQLAFDFVPGDPRRSGWSAGGGTAMTYAIDETSDAVPPFSEGLTAADTDAAIDRAMGTWDDLACSALDLSRTPAPGIDIGFIAFLNGLGGSPAVVADVQHAGFSDINFPLGVLGVAFTLPFVDSNGDLTDVDNNGTADVAFREIYYDPSYNWGVSGSPTAVDVESIALHEAGHGLSQAHFGTVRIKKNGTIKASPRAVMNALYSGPLRTLLGTDRGGHCSNWGAWPQR